MNLNNETNTLITMLFVGLITAVGQMLSSGEKVTWKHVVGRCITTSVLALAAGSILVWVPNVSPLALVGVSAMLSSLGTSALERMLQKQLEKKGAKHD
jgi:hypothetical protein